MNHWMIRLRFPAFPTQEFLQLIPAQRAIVDRLLRQGVIRTYSLTGDRRELWIVLRAENESAMQTVLNKLPLSEFAQITAQEAMFHLDSVELFPEPSVN